jgi:NAD(P)H-nitrite reductase large subunit
MACKEGWLPYDRPKLSKAMSIKPDKIYLRPADFFKNHDIEVLLNNEVVEFNGDAKNAKLKDGQVINFDYALLATGGM